MSNCLQEQGVILFWGDLMLLVFTGFTMTVVVFSRNLFCLE